MIENYIQWIMEISIALTGIGVTVILGIQIWNALTINKLIDNKLKEERRIIQNEIAIYYSKSKHIASSLSSFNLAFTLKETNQFTPAFHAYIQAIISANKADSEDICEMYADWLAKLLLDAAMKKTPIKITAEQRLEYISALSNLNSQRINELKNILIGSENASMEFS